MHTAWLKGHKNKEQRKKELLSYRNAFDELKKLLEDQFEESTPDYSSPSWAYEQADVNGANRKLRQIINLITVGDKE